MINNFNDRLDKLERSFNPSSVIRFIEKVGDDYVITQSNNRAEIKTKFKELNDIKKLIRGKETISFVEDLII